MTQTNIFTSILKPLIDIVAFTPTEEILISSSLSQQSDTYINKEVIFN